MIVVGTDVTVVVVEVADELVICAEVVNVGLAVVGVVIAADEPAVSVIVVTETVSLVLLTAALVCDTVIDAVVPLTSEANVCWVELLVVNVLEVVIPVGVIDVTVSLVAA